MEPVSRTTPFPLLYPCIIAVPTSPNDILLQYLDESPETLSFKHVPQAFFRWPIGEVPRPTIAWQTGWIFGRVSADFPHSKHLLHWVLLLYPTYPIRIRQDFMLCWSSCDVGRVDVLVKRPCYPTVTSLLRSSIVRTRFRLQSTTAMIITNWFALSSCAPSKIKRFIRIKPSYDYFLSPLQFFFVWDQGNT